MNARHIHWHSQRFWTWVGEVIAFLLAFLWAKPIG
jgi:hypothetical protein